MSGGSLGAQEAFGGARCLVRIEESHVGGKKRESKRGAGAGVGPLAAKIRRGGGNFYCQSVAQSAERSALLVEGYLHQACVPLWAIARFAVLSVRLLVVRWKRGCLLVACICRAVRFRC